MDFTREPIIETIITPKDGCKLVVRSSKSTGQEEYFVDAVEMVSFGHSLFFRSLERPKAFLVPVSDYEVLEVREARMVLKNMGPDRAIKIGGGRETVLRAAREEKTEAFVSPTEEALPANAEQEAQPTEAAATTESRSDIRLDKKRDRRRHYRKRRGGREEVSKEEEGKTAGAVPSLEEEKTQIPSQEEAGMKTEAAAAAPLSSNLLSSLLQPPPTLISETINRYRENALFKSAFFLTEEEQYKPHDKAQELLNEDEEDFTPALQEPTYEPLEPTVKLEGALEENIEQEKPHQEEGMEKDAIDKEESLPEEPFSKVAEDVFEEREEFKEPFPITEEDLKEKASLPLYAEEEETFADKDQMESEAVEKEGELFFFEEESPKESLDEEKKKKDYPQDDLPF